MSDRPGSTPPRAPGPAPVGTNADAIGIPQPPVAGYTGLSVGFAAVIASLVAVHVCMATTRVAATLWVLHQGYGGGFVGVLLSLFAVAPLGLSMWAGRLADRHGFHRPVGIGVAMAFAGAVLALAAQLLGWLWLLALGCLLCGGAVAVSAVAIQREAGLMARDPSQLKRVFSWVALGPALSNALAPVITGIVIDLAGFSAPLVLSTLLPLAAWAVALRVPRQAPAPLATGAKPRPAWDLLKDRGLRNLLIVNVAMSSCWDAHSFVVPVVGHAKGLSASSIGLVLGSFAAAATLVRLAIVRWAHHIDEVKALRAAMAIATVTLIVYAWLPGTLGLMAGSAVLGLALGAVQPMVLATMHHRHGQALGLRMLASNGATVAMPLGFGALAAMSVAAAPLWLMASVLVGAQFAAREMGRSTR